MNREWGKKSEKKNKNEILKARKKREERGTNEKTRKQENEPVGT